MQKPRKRSAILKEKTATQEKVQRTTEQIEADRRRNVIAAVNEVAGSDAGRIVFRELARSCHHNSSKVGMKQDRTVDNDSTGHNSAQELIYLKFRGMIRREHLIKIEFPTKEE